MLFFNHLPRATSNIFTPFKPLLYLVNILMFNLLDYFEFMFHRAPPHLIQSKYNYQERLTIGIMMTKKMTARGTPMEQKKAGFCKEQKNKKTFFKQWHMAYYPPQRTPEQKTGKRKETNERDTKQ